MPDIDVDRKRERERERRRLQTFDSQNIGPPPRRKNAVRYKKACESFRLFCETYLRDKKDPDSLFALDWSPDHLKVIEKVEQAVNGSLRFALAMPRGSGKTSLFLAGLLWAILTGRRSFGVLIASTGHKALDILKRIKKVLRFNQKLIDDFSPELHGIVKLNNESRRCAGQNIDGVSTGIEWLSDRIVFPLCPGSKASCAVLTVNGIEGAIEGQLHITVDGRALRPDIVLADDPQTRKSARSVVQSATRLEVLNASVAGLGGPRKGVSILLAGTKMRQNDLVDQILDKKKYPDWGGEVYKAVTGWPKNMILWDRYRSHCLEHGYKKGLEFYRSHRREMDEGGEVYWPERYHPEEFEVSGIQHFMNLLYKDRVVFWSEYQNDPHSEGAYLFHMPERSHVESLCVSTLSGIAQNSAMNIVAHIDIHENILFYTVSAISRDFTIRKIEHGTYPNQERLVFTESDCPNPLSGKDKDVRIYNGIVELLNYLHRKKWTTEEGRIRGTNLVSIDEKWNQKVVHDVAKDYPVRGFVYPYYGIGVTPSKKPIAEYQRRKDVNNRESFVGSMCYENVELTFKDGPARIGADVNIIKTWLHNRLKVSLGYSGSVSFNGGDGRYSSLDHNRFFIDHLFSEKPFLKEDKISGREKIMWENSDRNQNHWLDCLCANIAVGELLGAKLGFLLHNEINPAGSTSARRATRKRGFKKVVV